MSYSEQYQSVDIEKLITSQTREWELARTGYRDLEEVRLRIIELDNGSIVKIQFNPARIRSSAARVDKQSVDSRPCFLCAGNLPKEQKGVDFGDRYTILVNPFPIFKKHLTIPLKEHSPQLIRGKFGDMLRLSRFLDDFIVFYNGPRCGASAPDHFHFQAGNKGFMPVEKEFSRFARKIVAEKESCTIAAMEGYYRNAFILEGGDIGILCLFFDKIYQILQGMQEAEDEPMINILSGYGNGRWRVFVFPRSAHRPAQFFEDGENKILISPASVDLGGVFITPRKEDFDKLDNKSVAGIFGQVTPDNYEWQTLIKKLCNRK